MGTPMPLNPSPTTSPQRAAEIRRRLMHPDNAVKDPGVVLRRPPGISGINGYQAQENARAALLEARRRQREEDAKKMKRRFDPMVRLVPPKPNRDLLLVSSRFSTNYAIDYIAKCFDIHSREIKSPRRDEEVMMPRRIVYLALREVGKFSYPEIGRLVGRRDHTCPIRGIEGLRKLMAADLGLAKRVADILAALKDGIEPAMPSQPVDLFSYQPTTDSGCVSG